MTGGGQDQRRVAEFDQAAGSFGFDEVDQGAAGDAGDGGDGSFEAVEPDGGITGGSVLVEYEVGDFVELLAGSYAWTG